MTYQLKSIGKIPTVLGSKKIMKLKKDITKFGRHSRNDYFLDSIEHMCLISRWHAEIHRVEQDGVTKFILQDCGLNGTYVNDIKASDKHALELGDKITFGHPLGSSMEPGSKVEQPVSEFTFVFEKVEEEEATVKPLASLMSRIYTPPKLKRLTKTADSTLSPVISRVTSSNKNSLQPEITSRSVPSNNLDPFPARLFEQPVISSSDLQVTESEKSHADNVQRTRESPRPSAPRRSLLADTTENSTFVLKDISNTGGSLQGIVSIEQLIESRSASPVISTSSPNSENEDDSTVMITDDSVLQQAILSAQAFGQTDSEQDIFSASQPITNNLTDVKQSVTPLPSCVQIVISDEQQVLTNEHHMNQTHANQLLNNQNIIGILCEKSDSLEVKQEVNYPALSSIFDKPNQCTTFSSQCQQDVNQDTSRAVQSQQDVHNLPRVLLPQQNALDTFKHRGALPKVNFKPPAVKGSKKVHRRRGSAASVTSSTSTSSTPTNSKRKRKNEKLHSAKQRAQQEEEDTDPDTDVTWHYDHEKCQSDTCLQPMSSQVSWVQCDDCDGWYHTQCAGTNYDHVKNDVAEFHCGCL